MVRKIAPDSFAATVDDVQRLAPGMRVNRRRGEDAGAILHVGHRQTSQRADDEMMPTDLLAQGDEISMIASPDKSRAQDGEVPAMLLRKTSGHPFLPPFGDGVAIPGIDVRHPVQRGL